MKYIHRSVRWHNRDEGGWIFSLCDKYMIVPSLKVPGEFEAWTDDKYIGQHKKIEKVKDLVEKYKNTH